MKKLKGIKCLIIILAFTLLSMNVCAKDVDVTTTYKKKMSSIIKPFDGYLGYCCGRGMTFKYDAYARSTMATYLYPGNVYNVSVKTFQKKMKSPMKLYFGDATVKFIKFKEYKWPRNASYLWQNRNGRLIYVGGNWGECVPQGYVTRVMKKNTKLYEVTYKIYWVYNRKRGKLMGTFKLTMQKTNNKNGYIIKNIVRTNTQNVFI